MRLLAHRHDGWTGWILVARSHCLSLTRARFTSPRWGITCPRGDEIAGLALYIGRRSMLLAFGRL
ncbi:hypothetical protein J421_4671 (plasmid) [Gemmatirosa kalamazoonensis]|uniref:Uncharacterized protein n=1 Tax=Gemmatirosa kalamazoonensis TaxID=861299 RepID=W0RRC5_9BACT|nr:hypothetical protein [Gemmatirosa kalamazoonensis]AHG92138.1 hypothetical protein J421_4603 [Gemmatirosa kalamazoonensis]AHG92206.1 hypothetical protein J421_4671 [Gemmatirosa kalamazoonensis]